MDWNRIEQDWKQHRLSAKHRWDRLSDNELRQINGKHDELRGKIQQAYGISRHDAEMQIADWAYELEELTHAEDPESIQIQSQTLR